MKNKKYEEDLDKMEKDREDCKANILKINSKVEELKTVRSRLEEKKGEMKVAKKEERKKYEEKEIEIKE